MSEVKSIDKYRVLFVSHSSNFHGAEQSLLTILERLNSSIFDPVVLLPYSAGLLFDKIKSLGIKTYVLNAPWWISSHERPQLIQNLFDDILRSEDIVQIIKEKKIDIVYTNTVVIVGGAIAAMLTGVPHVWHVREILKDHVLKAPFELETVFALVGQLSERIIANSSATAEQFTGLMPESKLRVIHNGVDPTIFSLGKGRNWLRGKLSLDPDHALLAIIGTISESKGHDTLIKAMNIVRDRGVKATLLIIGQATNLNYKRSIKKQIALYKLKDRVRFLGVRQDIDDILPQLDIVVVAATAEPFGRTTIEAMAAGKPVVATNSGASPEIVINGETGSLVPPGDPEGIAGAIIKIIADPEKGKEMGRLGRIRVCDYFSVEKYVSSVEAELLSLCESSRKGEVSKQSLTFREVLGKLAEVIGPAELFDEVLQMHRHLKKYVLKALLIEHCKTWLYRMYRYLKPLFSRFVP